MASSPLEQPLAFGSSDAVYLPGSTAFELLNLKLSDDGALVPVDGIMPYTPYYSGYGRFHGLYHCLLDNNTRDLLLCRDGHLLRAFDGWSQSWTTLKSGLSNDAHPKFPDVFVTVAGKVVWCNGIDNPLAYDGYVLLPLGYDRAPGSPTPLGPEDSGDPIYRNEGGYSHPGRIGTVGDALSGQDGSILAGAWYYYVQYEDFFGNLSPLSSPSSPAVLRTERTAVVAAETRTTAWKDIGATPDDLKWMSVVLDDLTRQFAVDGINVGPEGTVARHLYRTPDVRVSAATPRFLCRIPDNVTKLYPDSVADAELQGPAREPVPVPCFKVACSHQGRLVIGNTLANPNMIMVSEPGLSGTFLKNAWAYLGEGEEVTGTASFQSQLLAFTSTSTYLLHVGPDSSVIAECLSSTIGCVAPASIRAAGWGALLWLGRDGVYQLQGGAFSRVSDPKFKSMRRSILELATTSTALWDQEAREWCIFIPQSGADSLRYCLTYDGKNFRERDYGVNFRALCTTKDHRNLILGGGVVSDNPEQTNLFILNRSTSFYSAPARTYRYISQWMSLDPTRRRMFGLSTLYLGFLEKEAGSLTVSIWGNGRRDTPQWQKTLTPTPTDWETGKEKNGRLDTLEVGTDRVQSPKVFWLKVDANLRSVDSMSFKVEATSGVKFSFVGWAADITIVDQGSRTPRGP